MLGAASPFPSAPPPRPTGTLTLAAQATRLMGPSARTTAPQVPPPAGKGFPVLASAPASRVPPPPPAHLRGGAVGWPG